MGKHTIAVSLGITYCVVTLAWCFALVKMVAWLGTGIPALAHSIIKEAEVVIGGRPVLDQASGTNLSVTPRNCSSSSDAKCTRSTSSSITTTQQAMRAASRAPSHNSSP